MAFTNDLSNNVLSHVFQGESYTPPQRIYVALFTSAGEVSGGGYSRQEITLGAPANGVIRNDSEVHFPLAETDWGTITQTVLFDENDNRLDEATTNALEVRESEKVMFPIGNYTIRLIGQEPNSKAGVRKDG